LQGKKIQKSRLVSRKSRFIAPTSIKDERNGLLRSRGGLVLNSSASGSNPLGDSEDQTPTPRAKKKKTPKMKEASARVKANESQLKPKALEIASKLQMLYPNPPIPLNHGSPFQLLCAVVLSAQTTDLKVNQVTPALFKMAPDAVTMASCEIKDIELKIASLGLAPTKAKNLKGLSVQLVEQYGGNVPDTFEALEELPGVGHKTASVVMAQVHGHDAFPVDTHIHRLAKRWGLSDGSSVEQTEADLKFLFPSNLWNDLHLQIIYFGRELCPAKGHDPNVCPICSWASTSRSK
jgi:endonuclease-3